MFCRIFSSPTCRTTNNISLCIYSVLHQREIYHKYKEEETLRRENCFTAASPRRTVWSWAIIWETFRSHDLTKTPAQSHINIRRQNIYLFSAKGFFFPSLRRHILFPLYINWYIFLYIYNVFIYICVSYLYIERKISVHFCWVRLKVRRGRCKPRSIWNRWKVRQLAPPQPRPQ